MSGRPTTSVSSPPHNHNGRPMTGRSDSEAPSLSYGPTSYAYPAPYDQQQQQGQPRHVPNQPDLHAQQEETNDNDGSSDHGDVFAYGPPSTAGQPRHLHQINHSQHEQHLSQHEYLSAAQLHNLVAATGLSSVVPLPSSGFSTLPESPLAPKSHSTHVHDHHDHPRLPETSPFAYEAGPNSYSMRPIPVSPGILEPQHTPTLDSISYSNISAHEPFQVALSATADSYDSSLLFPGRLKRVPSDPNASALEIGSRLSAGSPTSTQEDEEDSPYAEVRASVSNMDDPDMPTTTFRMWFLGLILVLVGCCLNTYFIFRYPAPLLMPSITLIIAYPLGKALAYILPTRTWVLPWILGGGEFTLNPGPFNVKEHVLIYMMANVGIFPTYVMNAIVVAERYYGLDFGPWFEILLIQATNLTGFGLAGMCRNVLVRPTSMVWPQNLVSCTVLNTLHEEDRPGCQTDNSRYRVLLYAMTGIFLWTFFPAFLFVGLSFFSWVCWIAPNSLVVNQLFGTVSGLGMGFITFDWSQITYIGSPLMVPWWAQVHVFAGFVLVYWIILPILYYTNTWHLAYMPIGGQSVYDRFGHAYNVTRILDSTGRRFDLSKYEAYSALYLPGPFAMVYLLAFAMSTALLVHTVLYYARTIYNAIRGVGVEEDDVHTKLMRAYPEVPSIWYAGICLLFLVMAIVTVEVWPTDMPVWALALSVLLPTLYLIPCGFIFAVTGQPPSINLLAEIIPGVLLSGRPLANMIFKGYAVQTLSSALVFTQDLKMGHYIKVPPRASFIAQSVATLLAGFLQAGVKQALFTTVKDICTEGQKSMLTCPHNRTFFSASAIWGLIGPTRQFGPGTMYHGHLWALLVGAFLPLPFWWWQRRFPNTRLKYINIPVFLSGPTRTPPATGINYSSWFLVGFIFQYLVRKRNFLWWSKFNYILSSALDSGTALSLLFIFVSLLLPLGDAISSLNWWGNTAPFTTLDGMTPLPAKINLGPGQAFDGPPGQ